jgi:hypothetical protein
VYLTGGDQGKMLQIPGPPARLLTLSHTHCRCVPVLLLIPRVHTYPNLHTHTPDLILLLTTLSRFLYLIKKKTYSTRVYTYSNHTHTNDQPHITRLLLFLYAAEKEQAHCRAKRWKKSVMERAKSRPQPCKGFCLHT